MKKIKIQHWYRSPQVQQEDRESGCLLDLLYVHHVVLMDHDCKWRMTASSPWTTGKSNFEQVVLGNDAFEMIKMNRLFRAFRVQRLSSNLFCPGPMMQVGVDHDVYISFRTASEAMMFRLNR